jgi:hypothetical protein
MNMDTKWSCVWIEIFWGEAQNNNNYAQNSAES